MRSLYLLLFTAATIGSSYAQEILSDTELFLKQNPRYQTYLQNEGRYLVLDVYRPGQIRRHRFYAGDELVFKIKGQRKMIRENITSVSDSSFTFTQFNEILNEHIHTEVRLSNVRKIRIYRRIPWVTQGAYMLPVAGGIFLISDTFIYQGGLEFGIQFTPESALIGGGIASLGFLCKRLSFPTYHVGGRHRLHVLRVK
ncbi:hypothetical protein [Runella slithyformis]|uniref:Uncharacterized protein n=1 Tax=Runella slithyformis (strain ATCC 29530 / DSM 19594 / LMG 11500 / NCIMB 11436 / LSU 4) TaxID=761193 RepID=A0A7U3ZNZ9_RUNSL|nr:hypothetical protein [Runella slithyformis]AEI50715.1 hypothetical protein Runsl_4386 [Runella slithyformis DSM 19594]